jgi:hypothetical protein
MTVDKAGRDDAALGVDEAGRTGIAAANRGDLTVSDTHVRAVPRRTGAVNNQPAPDHQVVPH